MSTIAVEPLQSEEQYRQEDDNHQHANQLAGLEVGADLFKDDG